MAKHFWAFLHLFAIAFSTFASAANELVISEYIEGSNNNKAIELCNPSSTPVNLATNPYSLWVYFNGDTIPTSAVYLSSGTVPAGGSLVIAYAFAAGGILSKANRTSNLALTFDGNDAIVLRQTTQSGGTVVDSFGQVGFGSYFAQDKTYRKKSCGLRDVATGDAFDPTVQYEEYPQDTIDGLGLCPSDCGQTSSPTASPTDMFDWYLKRVGDVTAKTNDPTGYLKISLTYEVPWADRRFVVAIFKIDCVTPAEYSDLSSDVTGRTFDFDHPHRNVQLIIDQSTVTQSAVWTQEVGATTAMIDVCVRTSLLLTVDSSDTVYNFDEQKVSVSIDLSQGFEVAAIDVDRADAAENNALADKNYGLTFCHCNAELSCASNTNIMKINQGDPVYICIKTTASSGIEIASVKELTYTQQGAASLTAINSGGTPIGLTKVANEGTNARVQTQLPATFFVAANQNINVVASGTVELRFGSALVPNRNLRFTIGDSVDHMLGSSASRMMQDQTNTTETGFSVSMALAPLESEDAPTADSKTGAIIGGIVGGIAGVAVIIVALVLAARRRRKQKEDDYKEGVYKDKAYTEDDYYKDDKEDDHNDEAFTEVDDKEEYAMTGSEIYA